MEDLVALVADKNMEFALKGGLDQPERLGTRQIRYRIRVHSERDGGVRTTGAQILRLLRNQFNHALLMLDWEGSGSNEPDAITEEAALDHQLQRTWGPFAKTIVIDPELDIWMWGSSNLLKQSLNWTGPQSIRDWAADRGFQLSEKGKPLRPKEALQAVLREVRLPRSSSLYRKIASQISLQKCEDAAFLRLREQLRLWFPPPST